MSMHDLLTRLDDSAFLGFRVWDFSFRSLRSRYGLTFLGRIMLRHPLKAVAGILQYRRLLRRRTKQTDITLLHEGAEEDLIARLVMAKTGLLVAVGFCQKPLAPGCPAGRPNHDCIFLDELDLEDEAEPAHQVCVQCDIRAIGIRALLAGANMHIMTSALDIARDVMIPSVHDQRFTSAMMCLCPYSIQAIALPLIICGIEGFLVGYASGNCVDHQQWLLADRGTKREMTTLRPGAYEKLLTLLRRLAERREKEGLLYVRFARRGNIYVPIQ